ncbi:hypothetical protein Agub_g9922, partial [Astrephomene gubernaculifera]
GGGPGGWCAPGGATAAAVPRVERLLQRGYYRLGLFVGRRPVTVVAAGCCLAGLACLGLLRLRVETDPQRLWVGPGSQAAREKAAYEASFGPFYRIEQMILATQPPTTTTTTSATTTSTAAAGGQGQQGSPSSSLPPPQQPHQPPIVTPDNVRLLFDMQRLVDELEAPLQPPPSSGPLSGRSSVRLADICYKPFGDVCATQSVLQYWRGSREAFEAAMARPAGSPGRMDPEYCFNHWYTECRSAYQAPVDPHVVLGGFPGGREFSTYSAGATSFVTTLPVSSDPSLRPAALAWEAAFLQLAADKLAPAAASANLTLSYSAERSVQDELTRESRADAATVAASYGIMLVYIAAALGSLPPLWGRKG